MDTKRFFEAILKTLKREYGEDFEGMTQDQKAGLIMIFAQQVTAEEPEIMQALSHAVYEELTT